MASCMLTMGDPELLNCPRWPLWLGIMNAVTQAVQDSTCWVRCWTKRRRLWAAAEAPLAVAELHGLPRRPGCPRDGGRREGTGFGARIQGGDGATRVCEHLLDPTRGDPQGPLRWTCSSAARLADNWGLKAVSERTVNRLLTNWAIACRPTARRLKPPAPGSGCAIPAHRPSRAGVSTPGPARSTEEEGVGRPIPQRRPGMAWGQPEEVKVHDHRSELRRSPTGSTT